MNLSRFLFSFVFASATVGLTSFGGPVAAQDADTPPVRVPTEGISVLDCDPVPPAPADSCIVRVPPNQQRGKLSRKSTGARDAQFEFVRSGDDLFPDGIDLSATVLLIDRTPTPGAGGGRRATWDLERAQIRRLVQALPQGELLAVYTFDEALQRVVDFTQDRDRVLEAVDGIELEGLNTRIATNTQEVINVLDRRDDLLLKNVIVVTDGREEGTSAMRELNRRAQEAGVTVSALGMIWSRPGDSSVSSDLDFLRTLTQGSLGSYRAVRLRLPEDARGEVGRFIDDYNSSIGGSGLIMPVGDPAPADITVTLRVPVPGDEGNFDTRRVTARFTPETPAANETTDDGEAAEGDSTEADKLFGYWSCSAVRKTAPRRPRANWVVSTTTMIC
jgi:hypothetical protein